MTAAARKRVATACMAAAFAFFHQAAWADAVADQLAQAVEPAYSPPTPEPPSSATFTLRQLVFSESVLLDKVDLDAIAKEYEGRELALGDLQAIVAKVNALYQARGMMTARAVLPPQRIENGAVRIELVEGKLGTVELAGNKYTKDRYILDRLPLKDGQVVNGAQLDRSLKWFNRTNEVALNASLKPGSAFGSSDVVLNVDEPQKYVLRLFADNEGVESTGENEVGLSFQANGLLGRGDVFNFFGTHSSGADNGSLSYTVPVTRRGGSVSIAYANNTTAINAGPLAELDVTAESSTWLLSYTQPWIATDTWLVTTPLTFSRTHSETRISEIPLGDFETDKVSLGIAADVRDPGYRAAFAQNIAQLESTDLFGQTTRHTVFNGNASLVYRFSDDWYGVGRAGWQLTDDEPLPPSDLFQVGGRGSVRGYAVGFVSGGMGYYGGLELHRQFGSLNAYAYFDAGEVKSKGFPKQSIQGTGIGALYAWKRLTLDFIAGVALADVLPDQDDYRLDLRAEYAF